MKRTVAQPYRLRQSPCMQAYAAASRIASPVVTVDHEEFTCLSIVSGGHVDRGMSIESGGHLHLWRENQSCSHMQYAAMPSNDPTKIVDHVRCCLASQVRPCSLAGWGARHLVAFTSIAAMYPTGERNQLPSAFWFRALFEARSRVR